jgi:hypothetical protein
VQHREQLACIHVVDVHEEDDNIYATPRGQYEGKFSLFEDNGAIPRARNHAPCTLIRTSVQRLCRNRLIVRRSRPTDVASVLRQTAPDAERRRQSRSAAAVRRWMEMQMISRSGVVAALLWVVLVPTAATAQPGGRMEGETVATLGNRDLNGTIAFGEKVVTERARTNDGEQVIVDTYLPSIEGGRLVLSRRVRRVVTATIDGSRTVEESEERNLASPSEPLRMIRRTVTTVRRSGADASVTERQVFEVDVNGRLVPVLSQTEQTSGK